MAKNIITISIIISSLLFLIIVEKSHAEEISYSQVFNSFNNIISAEVAKEKIEAKDPSLISDLTKLAIQGNSNAQKYLVSFYSHGYLPTYLYEYEVIVEELRKIHLDVKAGLITRTAFGTNTVSREQKLWWDYLEFYLSTLPRRLDQRFKIREKEYFSEKIVEAIGKKVDLFLKKNVDPLYDLAGKKQSITSHSAFEKAQFGLNMMTPRMLSIAKRYISAQKKYIKLRFQNLPTINSKDAWVSDKNTKYFSPNISKAYFWKSVLGNMSSQNTQSSISGLFREMYFGYEESEALSKAQKVRVEEEALLWEIGMAEPHFPNKKARRKNYSKPAEASDLNKGAPKIVVIKVQVQLQSLGYDPGPPDGLLGSRTRKAIKNFQNARGLSADGKVDTTLLAELQTALLENGSSSTSPQLRPKLSQSSSAPAFNWPKWHSVASEMQGAIARPRLSSEDVYEAVKDSVWMIVAGRSISDFERKELSQGSAVAISPNNLLTNCHVVKDRPFVVVIQGEKVMKAKVSAADPDTDRCILTVNESSLLPVFGVRVFSGMKVGERVYTIGAPSGLERTLGEGIISGLRPSKDGNLIQTTAPISPGSSGGGLFDSTGHLIGITKFLLKNAQSLNFAIAAEDFWR